MNSLSHLSKKKGSGGKRINEPEGFIVEEIFNGENVTELNLENVDNSEYITFVLEKKNLTTYDAIRFLSDSLKVDVKRFSIAGQKDKNAITYQLVSCWKGREISSEKLMEISKKNHNIKIARIWNTNFKVRIGTLTGNSFTIRLTEVEDIGAVERIMQENGDIIPNYFGPQRFGTRSTNVDVARCILLKDYESAIKYLLKIPENESISECQEANELGLYEKRISNFLKERGYDSDSFRNAIKMIPASILKLILDSYQSYLFNVELSFRIKNKLMEPLENDKTCGFNRYGFVDLDSSGNQIVCSQLIGYDSRPNDVIKDILWEEGIEIGDFKLREFPGLNLNGSWRPLFVNVKDLNIKKDNDEYELKFKLTKGAYATSFLREITDIKRI
ncbi:MAG: tRNA pseudouridine(13) synthase TruD [Candidatus Micrarchaeia archaeon]